MNCTLSASKYSVLRDGLATEKTTVDDSTSLCMGQIS